MTPDKIDLITNTLTKGNNNCVMNMDQTPVFIINKLETSPGKGKIHHHILGIKWKTKNIVQLNKSIDSLQSFAYFRLNYTTFLKK
jgi:hypothetical protein